MTATARFHGGLPEGWRDHGVFETQTNAVTNATAEYLAATAEVEDLSTKKAAHNAKFSALVDKVKSGQATSAETLSLPDVAADSKRLAHELADARSALTLAAQKKDATERAVAHEGLDSAVESAEEHRAEFEEHYRKSCIALGAYCAFVERAGTALNRIGRGLPFGAMPEERRKVEEISKHPNPLPALLDAGYDGTKGFGWNIQISVVPVLPKNGEVK